jgi:hypothetical protein
VERGDLARQREVVHSHGAQCIMEGQSWLAANRHLLYSSRGWIRASVCRESI